MDIKRYLQLMIDKDASDIFYRAGSNVRLRIDGQVVSADEIILSPKQVSDSIEYLATHEQKELFRRKLDVDFSRFIPELQHRFRVNIFMQQNLPSLVIRKIRPTTCAFEELNLPADVLKKLSMETRGMVLMTGSAGSGKSTTISSMIEYINTNCNKHILSVEEPIEFIFKEKKSVINQRELGQDVPTYSLALRAFTLQSPDVIFISNIRDYDTMSSAFIAAETGVLVLSTLHTVNAAQTVERIINFFPPYQHQEIRTQLSSLLKGVISLRLLPLKDKPGRVPAYETMLLTPTISRLIREGKIWEIPQFIENGAIFGMQTFEQSLLKLVREGKIKEEDAITFSDNKDEFALALRGMKTV